MIPSLIYIVSIYCVARLLDGICRWDGAAQRPPFTVACSVLLSLAAATMIAILALGVLNLELKADDDAFRRALGR